MYDSGKHWHKRLASGLSAVAMAAAISSAAHGDLLHKYTFNSNSTEDSQGNADGVLIDRTGIATYTGGALDLRNNNNLNSGRNFSLPGTVGAYVDLPNGIFTETAAPTGQITLEMWLTVQEQRNWAEAFVFGTSTGGEDVSDNGDNQSYVALVPQSDANDFRATTRSSAGEAPLINGPPLPVNQRQHVVLVLNGLDQTLGNNGTASLYLNNGAPVMAAIQPTIDNMTNNNNWLGRSLFGGDPLLDGLIDEFRIYNHALTAEEVETSFQTGPEAAPIPVLIVDRNTKEIRIVNQTPGNVQIKGYSIGSAAGGLNPAAWVSIDAGNTFDPDGLWTTTQPLTSTNFTEANTGQVTDGGSLAATNGFRSLGQSWVKTPFEDLTFSVTNGNGVSSNGLVQYVGTAAIRSDFNNDGLINAADWALFVPNSFTTFASSTTVAAYLKGDLDGDKDNDFQDYRLFKADFIDANGVEAFAALAGAVPEPGTLTLGVVATALLIGASRRRHRR